MGALATKALRPIKSFNIENRAHRVISREKPTPAPRYPTNIEDLKRALEADPDLDEKLNTKDENLDNRLKEVYVTSLGIPEDDITRNKKSRSTTRPLPKDRKMPPQYEFGFKESERVPYGKTTLRDAINFISANQTDPKQVTATEIALKYKLREEDVQNILKYFKTYEVYLPETKTSKALFAGPATLRKELYKQDVKEIGSENTDSDKEVKENKKIKN